MKKLNFAFLRALSALIMGILLVAFPNEVGNYFIIVIGVVFLVPSLISLISYAVMKNRDGVKHRNKHVFVGEDYHGALVESIAAELF